MRFKFDLIHLLGFLFLIISIGASLGILVGIHSIIHEVLNILTSFKTELDSAVVTR